MHVIEVIAHIEVTDTYNFNSQCNVIIIYLVLYTKAT